MLKGVLVIEELNSCIALFLLNMNSLIFVQDMIKMGDKILPETHSCLHTFSWTKWRFIGRFTQKCVGQLDIKSISLNV